VAVARTRDTQPARPVSIQDERNSSQAHLDVTHRGAAKHVGGAAKHVGGAAKHKAANDGHTLAYAFRLAARAGSWNAWWAFGLSATTPWARAKQLLGQPERDHAAAADERREQGTDPARGGPGLADPPHVPAVDAA